MQHGSTNSPAKKERRLTISAIRVRQAHPPAWPAEPEIIPVTRSLQSLLDLCWRSDFTRRLLDYTVEVKHVRQCESCGMGVALISVAGEIRWVDAIRDPDPGPFCPRGWTANALGSDHTCGGRQ
ncbi:MAG: hypothetical protein WBP87_03470 [Candidatus Sulfotelmatobacter sp.]